jgi:8-oxo-dGTP pyrophosphatase MutT (NUDIX family)
MDHDRQVLLVHFEFETDLLPTGLWACPGGGIDPGESLRDGLIRELHEELGLEISDSGEPVWLKEHVFPMSRWDGQHDTFYFIEVDHFEPRPQFTADELRAENLAGMRWWAYDELLAAQAEYDAAAHARELQRPGLLVFSPRRLGHLVRALVEHGRPAEPLQIDPL